jgi:hypothetical protein
VSDVGWDEFVVKLQLAGFFGEHVKGSQGWKEREQKARQGWRDLQSSE